MLPRQLIARCAANYPDKTAYYCGEAKRTWRQMHERSDRLAAALQAIGVRKGDVVAILGRESFEIYEHFFACMKIGAIRLGINRRYPAVEMMHVIRDSAASVLLVQASMIEALRSIRAELLAMGVTLVGYDGEHDLPFDYERALSRAGTPQLPFIDAQDTLFYSYTSGTTGVPKGVVLTHGSVMNTIFQSLVARGLGPDEIWYMPGQSSWVTAIMLMFGLGNGASQVLPDGEFEIRQFLSDIERLRVTSASLLPTMMQRAIQEQRARNYDLSSLRIITYGSAPASSKLIREANEVFGCEFLQGYGMTEAGGWVTHLTAEDHRRALNDQPELLGSVGRVGVTYELSIRGEDGEPLPPNTAGEIWVSGKSLMKGYLNRAEETAEAMRGDWLCTNDIGRVDERGYLYLLDRKKFMIISGAVNVFPAGVEAVLMDHACVCDAAVVGMPHPEWGEAVGARVQTNGDAVQPNARELISFCQQRLSKPECPKLIVFDEIPKNAMGKTDKIHTKEKLLLNPDVRAWALKPPTNA